MYKSSKAFRGTPCARWLFLKSVFDGLGLPQDHFDFVRENTKEENNVPALAITNHGNMNSFAHAYLYAKDLNKAGTPFKFIPGCEVYMHPDIDTWKKEYKNFKEESDSKKALKKLTSADIKDEDAASGNVENEEETKSSKFRDPVKRRHHLVVLAKHSKGLEHLFHTVSRGFMEGYYYYPRIDLKMLKQYKGDFVVSTACIGGPLAFDVFGHFQDKEFDDLKPSLVDDPLVMQKVLRDIENTTDRLCDAVGRENFFLELQFNKLNAQHLVNRCLIELHHKTGIPLIATADSHYCRPEVWKEREIYKKLGWLRNSIDAASLPQSIDDLKTVLYPKNAQQMWDEYKNTSVDLDFYDDELVCDAIERTHDIAFNVIGDVVPDCKIKLPSYVVPKDKTAAEALRELSYAGLKKMGLASRQKYIDRLEYELSIILDRDFCEYFLTMKTIIDIASDNMLVGAGRGCFLPASQVIMGDGSFKRIEDVIIDDVIVDAFGTKQTVVETFSFDVNEKLLELEFDNGSIVRCTKDHEFLTARGWIKADELLETDDIKSIYDTSS